jgi:hypothetical protein
MTYEYLLSLHPPAFRRACGVGHSTFAAMVEVLRPHLDRQGKRGDKII